MAHKIASGMILTLALVVFSSISPTLANPVPYPVIRMPYEYIYANITVTDGYAYARVNGTYPFENLGYQNISMSYPLPQDAADVSVHVDGNLVPWWYTNQTYSTIFGDLPVINWTIDPAPSEFTVEVDYRHLVSKINQNFTYFYAMGTWKGIYSKQMTAYVTVDVNMESIAQTETLEVYAYQVQPNSTTQEWIWKSLECTVNRINNTFRAEATVQSDMFTPIKGDFLLTFKVRDVIPEFPSSFVLSLSIVATILTIIFYRRKRLISPGK